MSSIKQRFLESLHVRLNADGFGKFRNQLAAIKSDESEKRLHVAFVQHGKGEKASFHAILDLAVRYHRIESFIEKWKAMEFAEKSANSSTIGVELGMIENGKQKRYPFATSVEAEEAGRWAYEDFVRLGKPYLQSCANSAAVIERFEASSFKQWHQTLGGIALRLPLMYMSIGKLDAAATSFERMAKRLNDTSDYYAPTYQSFRCFAEKSFIEE